MGTVITIVQYDPRWRTTFAQLRSTYASALGSTRMLAIEHVGSTAVDGLSAKPVIDIAVATEDVGAATDALHSIGFRALGEHGIERRWAFRQPEGLPATHTYVVEEGSLAWRNHLAVRDALRADPVLRAEHAQLKRELASSGTSIDEYAGGTSALLRCSLERAGLTDNELAAIERANHAG